MKNNETLKKMTLHERERYLKMEYDDLFDKYERLSADFQNYRRNKEQEMIIVKSTASRDMLLNILEFYDTLRYSIITHPNITDSENNIMFSKFKQVLRNAGAEMYCKEGDDFDPELHDAIHVANDPELGKHQVIRVIKEGCKLNGKIIRHAQVIVNE